jgi:hypothetical protein
VERLVEIDIKKETSIFIGRASIESETLIGGAVMVGSVDFFYGIRVDLEEEGIVEAGKEGNGLRGGGGGHCGSR